MQDRGRDGAGAGADVGPGRRWRVLAHAGVRLSSWVIGG
jgi:hypothetical protein